MNFIKSKKCKFSKWIKDEIKIKIDESNIIGMLERINLKNLYFNRNDFFIYQENEKLQLDILNEEKLNKHFQDFLSTTKLEEKEEKMHFFSNKITDTLNDLKKDKNYKEVIEKYFDEKNINRFILMCQGYFRHPKKNKKSKIMNQDLLKYSNEWYSYRDKPEKNYKLWIVFFLYI